MLATAPAEAAPAERHYDGKLEAPTVVAGGLDAGGDPAGRVLAAWDLARGTDGVRILDAGPDGHHGEVVNLPTRGVTGSRWSGGEMCWRHAPAEYAAIHFHSDDLYDCGWETDFSFTVPDGMPSALYGARLRCGDHEDIIPFYVTPEPGRADAPVLFLASTFTYQAYANHTRGNLDAAFRGASATGAPIRTTPTTMATTRSPPTTATRTAPAWRCRRGCGRC